VIGGVVYMGEEKNPLRELTRFQFIIFAIVDGKFPRISRLLWPYLADVSDEHRIEECKRRIAIEREIQGK
jgi:hypothetical protein